jgi:hypothetical protein
MIRRGTQRATAQNTNIVNLPEGVEVLNDPRFKGLLSRKQIMADAQVQADEIAKQKKKNKLIVGVAIGVGVISIIALIYLLRKK